MKNILLILLFCVLSGCGFHAGNGHEYPSILKNMHIKGGEQDPILRENLSYAFETDGNTSPRATLEILHASRTATLQSDGNSELARTYSLHYSVRYQILDENHKVLLSPITQSISTPHYVYSNHVLGNDNETTQAYSILQRQMSYKILYKLSSTDVRNALEKQYASSHDTGKFHEIKSQRTH